MHHGTISFRKIILRQFITAQHVRQAVLRVCRAQQRDAQ